METTKLTFSHEITPEFLSVSALASWMHHIGYGGVRSQVLDDPAGTWDEEHGTFFQGSDGCVYSAHYNYRYETQFAVFRDGAWSDVTGLAWWAPARAMVRLQRRK